MYLGCSSESYSQALGAGRLTLPGFIRICGAELRQVGYQGCLSVEYEGEEAPETAVPRAVAHLRRVLGA